MIKKAVIELTSTGIWPYWPICCGDRGPLDPEEFSRSIGGGWTHNRHRQTYSSTTRETRLTSNINSNKNATPIGSAFLAG